MTKAAPVAPELHATNDPNVWFAESQSAEGVTYLIEYSNGRWSCECRAADFGRHCKHVTAVEALEAYAATAAFERIDWDDLTSNHHPGRGEHEPYPGRGWQPFNPTTFIETKELESMTTSAWSNPNFAKEAERGTGYEPPALEDDIYFASIVEVGEPFDQPKFDEPNIMQTRFYVQWELEGDDVPDGAQLRQYMTLPDAYLNSGFLNEKSNIFVLMSTLGYDMNGRFRVNPPEWVGKRARLVVENKPNKDGELRPRIKTVMPLKRASAPKARAAHDEDDE